MFDIRTHVRSGCEGVNPIEHAFARWSLPLATVISARSGIAERSAPPRAATERILVAMKPARAPNRRHLPGSPFNTPPVVRPVKEFFLSDQVTHDRYGLGRVIAVDEGTVLVDFGDRTERINAPYSKLTRL